MTPKSLKTRLMENSFWLSVLLHLLLLVAILLVIAFKPQEHQQIQKQANQYVPSYIYRGAITPSTAPMPTPQRVATKSAPTKTPAKTVQPEPESQTANIEATPNTTIKPNTIAVTKKRRAQPTSLFSASTEMLHQEQMRSITHRSDEEPILLIGDTTKIADPLIKLMARSLSANFRYPETEGMMGIKGRVLVVLTLHPEGYYSDVEMVKSSDSQNLDAAALFAVNKAPQVFGAGNFIKKPKRFLVGFVFE